MTSSVRQRTSSLPRTASNRSRGGRGAPWAGRGRCKTTSPAAFTENSTGAPGNNRSSSRIRLGMVTWPLLVKVVDMVGTNTIAKQRMGIQRTAGCSPGRATLGSRRGLLA